MFRITVSAPGMAFRNDVVHCHAAHAPINELHSGGSAQLTWNSEKLFTFKSEKILLTEDDIGFILWLFSSCVRQTLFCIEQLKLRPWFISQSALFLSRPTPHLFFPCLPISERRKNLTDMWEPENLSCHLVTPKRVLMLFSIPLTPIPPPLPGVRRNLRD